METQTIKSVDELKSGDILVNTNHGFEIEIVEIGKKNTRYHESAEQALKTKTDYVFGVFKIDDSIKRGDSINDAGEKWESS